MGLPVTSQDLKAMANCNAPRITLTEFKHYTILWPTKECDQDVCKLAMTSDGKNITLF